MRKSRAILIAVSIVFTSFLSHASAAQRAFNLTAFSALELDLPARYVIREAGTASARVSGEPEVIDRIVVEQHADRVKIYVPGTISIQGQLVIEVDTVGLNELLVTGAGQVEASGFTGSEFSLRLTGAPIVSIGKLDVRRLSVDMQGSGSVDASGRASAERMRVAGAASWRGADLAADSVEIQVQGSPNVEVMARAQLTVRLVGAGRVRYRGDPKLSTHIIGTGTVGRL
jgi:hypothetical protein